MHKKIQRGLLQSPAKNQKTTSTRLPSSDKKSKYRELSICLQQHRLTDCLELLEKLGYTGDAAIARLRYLQWEGVA